MKREEYLKLVEYDSYSKGFVSDGTVKAGLSVKVSADSFKMARYRGQEKRDKLRENYFELQAIEYKIRESIKRALSCGDRLNTPESKKLIDALHRAKDSCETESKRIEKLTLNFEEYFK